VASVHPDVLDGCGGVDDGLRRCHR
jgi:hypothetical protein